MATGAIEATFKRMRTTQNCMKQNKGFPRNLLSSSQETGSQEQQSAYVGGVESGTHFQNSGGEGPI